MKMRKWRSGCWSSGLYEWRGIDDSMGEKRSEACIAVSIGSIHSFKSDGYRGIVMPPMLLLPNAAASLFSEMLNVQNVALVSKA